MATVDLSLVSPPPVPAQGKRPEVTRLEQIEAGKALQPRPVKPVTAEQVEDAVQRVSDFVQVVRRELEFAIDEDSGRTVITVLDSETQEIVRQIPPEKLMVAAENIERLQGLLFEGKA